MVVFAIAFNLVQPQFLSSANVALILAAATVLTVVALGEFLVIVSGAIDVSIGANVAVGAGITAVCLANGLPAVAAVVVGVAASILVGAANGLLVTVARLPAIVVTLAMLSLIRGALAFIFSGKPLLGGQENFSWLWAPVVLGLPLATILTALGAVLVAVFVRWTEPGRRIFAVGGNEAAAASAGIQVRRTRIMTFMIAGATAGLAGVLVLGRTSMPQLGNIGVGYEFLAIGAIVLGGTNIMGGSGRVLGVVAGTVLLFAINNVMVLTGIPATWQNAVVGMVILVAVIIDVQGRRKQRKGSAP